MKREVKIIGIKPYETKFNDNIFVGLKYYYIYNEENCSGNACDSFKIPNKRSADFPNVHIGDEYKIYLERTANGFRLDDMVQL